MSAAPKKPVQVLLVEDNAEDAQLLRQMFGRDKEGFVLTHLTRMGEAEARLAQGGVDIVLLDMGLPDGHGLDTLRRARAAAPGVAMIVLTGLEDEVLAAEAIQGGAQDYVIKGQIENRALPRALRYAIERQRMQEEAEVLRTHQLQVRDDFLSHVSHELRSPLTSIYSFSSIIADGLAGQTTAQQDDYLQIISRNVRQLQSMIEDLLEVTQAQTGKLSVELQAVNLNDAISYAVDTLQSSAILKEVGLAFEPAVRLPAAYADGTRVRQVMTILLDNAMKFTPAGGSVRVEAFVRPEDPNFLQVEVVDTGCGISEEAAEHIFEHLYKVRDDPGHAGRRGLGLGLFIAKELVNGQGGAIWVKNEAQGGSRFTFTLPIFSLTGFLRPVVMREKAQGEVLAMIAVEVSNRDGSPDVPREVLDATRAVLRQCLRPETDVLLPDLIPAHAHRLFFVAAYTQERGAEVIGRRMLEQIRNHAFLEPKDYCFAVSHSFPPALVQSAGQTPEAYLERVADGIQTYIYQMIRKETPGYESKENTYSR